MAVVWSKTVAGDKYEVRSAGSYQRLYTNGVLHSQYSPKNLMTGSVWDLLTLGGFYVPENQLKRILVLGVGGGASILQLQHFFPNSKIWGVELNPVHIEIGKRFFGLDTSDVNLIRSDAVRWLRQYRGKAFDLIIDDLFDDNQGDPVKAVPVTAKWLGLIKGNLSSHGAMVMNFADTEGFNQLAARTIYDSWQSRFRLSTPNCENVVAILCRQDSSSALLRRRIRQFPELDNRRSSCRLKYHIRQLAAEARH